MSIGDWIYDIFGNSEWGVLLCIFLIFLVDALIFPALPELFFAGGMMYNAAQGGSLLFGAELILVVVIAEVLGVLSLYYVVGRIRIPKRIEKLVNGYVGFLVLGDERLILLNRVAPMIPFCGAFIRIACWDIKKSMLYVVAGCVIKYGIIAIMCDFFFEYYNGPDAQTYTLIFIVLVIAVSFVFSYVMKKRAKKS
ncbi:MAG: hypothetical protein LBR42_05095 [Candidatus Methanoplasma sp.]|jgi:hypothetical protein|nr:hypothetical protein [Candidatus Methanoplasma sp.]